METNELMMFCVILVLINGVLYITNVNTDKKIEKMKQEMKKEIEKLKKGNNDENHEM